MEKLFYESRPYFFLVLSAYALDRSTQSTLAAYSGTLLLAMSLLIIAARWKNRGVI
jgi:hypothetical protein